MKLESCQLKVITLYKDMLVGRFLVMWQIIT